MKIDKRKNYYIQRGWGLMIAKKRFMEDKEVMI